MYVHNMRSDTTWKWKWKDSPSVDDLQDAVEHADRVSRAAPLLTLRFVVVDVSVGKHLRARHRRVWTWPSSLKIQRASPPASQVLHRSRRAYARRRCNLVAVFNSQVNNVVDNTVFDGVFASLCVWILH